MNPSSGRALRPPRLAEWLLRRFFADNGRYTHLGDFEEVFSGLAAEKGRFRAGLWYWGHVLRSLPAFVANKIYWSLSMLRNYAVISFRMIVKNAGYSLISLLGLAVGLAAFILILAYVRFETGYDRFHEKGDRIFRLLSAEAKPGRVPAEFDSLNCDPMASGLKTEFPEVRHAARVMKQYNDPAILGFADRSFAQSGLFADQDFLEIFSFPLIRGDKSSALSSPGSLVLSESAAQKLFRDEDPVGKTVSYGVRGAKVDLKVTGIIGNVPKNSHLQFDYLLAMSALESRRENAYMFKNWDVANFAIYAELADPAARPVLEDKIGEWLRKVRPETAESGLRFSLQPLKDIHLRSNIIGELATNNEIRAVSLFFAIAVLILLIAAINYMNLVTARASTRAREIGIRKVTGAGRSQLLRQFLGESVLFAFLALALALAFVRFLLLPFNTVAGTAFVFGDLLSLSFFPFVAVSTLLVGLLAGAYPAFALSAFQPAIVLKERTASGRRGSRLRRVLVVVQFAASIILIICALTVSGQLRYVRNQKLGYNRENVVLIPFREPEAMGKAAVLKAGFLRLPEVDSVSVTSGLPTKIRSQMLNNDFISDAGEKITANYHFDYVDENFLKVFQIELAAGRNLSPGERNTALVNETFAKTAGWKDPIGKEIKFFDPARIVGVVKDFHFETFHRPIAPMVLFPEDGNMLAVRIRSADVPGVIARLREVFARNVKTQPWDFSFFDEEYDALYRKERRMGRIFEAFAVLAILIACLGLLGLAAFAVERRTKEMGIRKVMGASAPDLTAKVVREFIVLVVLANAIAWPVAYFAMSRWLQSFAYRIRLGWGTFVLAALLTVIVAFLTVGTQALRAASADPVRSLRYE